MWELWTCWETIVKIWEIKCVFSGNELQQRKKTNAEHNHSRARFSFRERTIINIFISKRTLCDEKVSSADLWPVMCMGVCLRVCVFFHFPCFSCRLWSNNRGLEKWCVLFGDAAVSKGTLESSGYMNRVNPGSLDAECQEREVWASSLSPFTFSPLCCSRYLVRQGEGQGRQCLEVGEGSRNMKCITAFNMQCCKVRKAAERRNSSVKISERMLQHAVTRGRLFRCIPNDSTVSYASSNKSFCCLPSITTKVPTCTLWEHYCTSRFVLDVRKEVITS